MVSLRRLIWGLLFVAASAAASDRFTLVMGGAAVLDSKTGLVWEQSPGVQHLGWADAPDYCRERATGGQGRMAGSNKEELASLVDSVWCVRTQRP